VVYADAARTLEDPSATDPHAPDEYRTNTVLQDLPEFAKSFSCKKTATMAIQTVPRLVTPNPLKT